MLQGNHSVIWQGIMQLVGNGRFYVFILGMFAQTCILILALFHDIKGNTIIALFAAVIGGAFGHITGNLQGRMQQEKETREQNGG